MKAKTNFLGIAFLLMTTTFLQAQVIPGRWEKVEALAPGTDIIVKMKFGNRLEGVFKSVVTEELRLADSTGKELGVPRSGVQSLETTTKAGHKLRNRMLIGAGIGSVAGILGWIGYAKSVTASGSIWGGDSAGYVLGSGLVGAGMGALTGAAVSAIIKDNEVVYRSR